MSTWACATCTFANQVSQVRCELCESPCPPTTQAVSAACTRILVVTLDGKERFAVTVKATDTIQVIKNHIKSRNVIPPHLMHLALMDADNKFVKRLDDPRMTLAQYEVRHEATVQLWTPPREDFKYAFVAISSDDLAAILALLDFTWPPGALMSDDARRSDTNAYTFGSLASINVILACMPAGHKQQVSATHVIVQLQRSFPSVTSAVLLTVAGAIPNVTEPLRDAHKGDIVVSFGGDVVEPDLQELFGQQKFKVARSTVGRSDPILMAATLALVHNANSGTRVAELAERAASRMSSPEFRSRFRRPTDQKDVLMDFTTRTEVKSDRGQRPQRILCGGIASTTSRLCTTEQRNLLRTHYNQWCVKSTPPRATILCADTTSAGIAISAIRLLVVAGIADYCDEYAQDSRWRGFASASAAGFAYALFESISESSRASLQSVTAGETKGDTKSATTSTSGSNSLFSAKSVSAPSTNDSKEVKDAKTAAATAWHRPRMHQCTKTISSNMFTIAAIATLPVELDALTASFDFVFGTGWLPSADIVLRFGRVGQHNVVAACLIQGGYGSSSAGAVVTDIKRLFPLVANMAMVGVGSALSKTSPEGEAVHLGDVVWSTPHGRGSVTEYDLSGVQVTNEGKTVQGEAKEVGNLSPAGRWWLGIASQMNATRLMSGSPLVQVGTDIIDKLTSGAVASPFDFKRPATGEDGRRARTRDAIQMEHTGSIACARTHLRRNARFRDYLHEQTGHLCLESAAAGLASAEIPYMVIRAICDYNDEHATEVWQPYAAAFAAASFKCFLLTGTATEALSQKLKATAIPIVPGPDLGRVDKKYVADFKYEGPAESKLVGEAGHRLNGGGGCGASSKSAAMDVSSDDQQQTSPVAVASSDRRRPGVVDPKRSAALAALDSRLPAAKKPRLEETAGGAGDGESKTASKADSKRVAVDVKVQAPSGPGGPVVLEEEIRNLCQQEERGADADSVAEATIARLLKALQIRDHMDSVDIPATVIRQVAERMARVIRVSEAATEIKSSKAA